MTIINGIEYLTKEEVTMRCKAFAGAYPGSVFHNYAHCKVVRTADNRTTLYEWNKLYADLVKDCPELKGLWTLNTRYSQEGK